ncbi:MAG: hypothetical protein FWG32_07335, partial [Oscillospiraceae bacterium]|nr:hypothetical protein [Oscillospiraceae bacterium]
MKRAFCSFAAGALIFAFLAASEPAYAAADIGPQYTATLQYYDDIQITYTLNYPAGGVWNGAGDIPIGGTGVSSQIYCVDPFVHFHSV